MGMGFGSRHSVIQSAIVREAPVSSGDCAVRTNGCGDGLARKRRIRQGRAVIENLKPGFVIGKLVREKQGVIVTESVKSSHWVSVIGKAFVAGNMTLYWPGLAAVERLVETLQVVVALGAHEPFGLPNEVLGVGGIDSKVRLTVVVYE